MKIDVKYVRTRKKNIEVKLEDAWRAYEEELDNHIAKCVKLADEKEDRGLSPVYIETALAELDYFMKHLHRSAKQIVKLLREYKHDGSS